MDKVTPSRPASVTIPMDYLTTTHILLSASYEKMSEVLGDSQAMMFFCLASDSARSGKSTLPKDIGSLKEAMATFGYKLTQKGGRDQSTFRLHCPHAEKIHPRLGQKATFCPMSQVALAVVRGDHPRSVVQTSRLEKDGSYFEVKIQD
jgi:hypothetical protein